MNLFLRLIKQSGRVYKAVVFLWDICPNTTNIPFDIVDFDRVRVYKKARRVGRAAWIRDGLELSNGFDFFGQFHPFELKRFQLGSGLSSSFHRLGLLGRRGADIPIAIGDFRV